MPCTDLEWTKPVPQKFFAKRKQGGRQKYGSYGIQTDVAVGAYIQHALKLKGVDVDLIPHTEISKTRLRSNDLNFCLQYSMVCASYIDQHYPDKSNRNANKNHLKACLLGVKNVYPPMEYQEFIQSKINYYSYLQAKNLEILPTFTMTNKEYEKLGHDASMKKVCEWWQLEELGTVIGKPVLGMGGDDCDFFHATDKGRSDMSRYFRKVMKKYPGVIVQKTVKGFGNSKECPELRMYFMGDKYKYSVSANRNCVLSHPEAEGGTLKVPLDKLKVVTKNIMKKLPPIVMPNGVRMPRLITRLDMGWRIDGKFQPFMNEVEFEPSLYLHKPLREELINYIASCAKQVVNITRRYIKGPPASRARGKDSRHVLKPLFLKQRLYSSGRTV